MVVPLLVSSPRELSALFGGWPIERKYELTQLMELMVFAPRARLNAPDAPLAHVYLIVAGELRIAVEQPVGGGLDGKAPLKVGRRLLWFGLVWFGLSWFELV